MFMNLLYLLLTIYNAYKPFELLPIINSACKPLMAIYYHRPTLHLDPLSQLFIIYSSFPFLFNLKY